VHPVFSWWCRDEHLSERGETGREVPRDFQYRSNTNAWQLDKQELLRILLEIKADERVLARVA
jgi:hypothetical protein